LIAAKRIAASPEPLPAAKPPGNGPETIAPEPPLRLRQAAVPDWSNLRQSLIRRLADMSALFNLKPKTQGSQDWVKISERRSSPPVVRLRAGLFIRYQSATGAKEFDTFVRDAKTWAAFEHAVLPELARFTFVDKSRQATVSEPAVLADAMYHIWTATTLGRDLDGRPTTISVISELANYLCSVYETQPIDRRAARRNWLGFAR
jgi:hypothetical protein